MGRGCWGRVRKTAGWPCRLQACPVEPLQRWKPCGCSSAVADGWPCRWAWDTPLLAAGRRGAAACEAARAAARPAQAGARQAGAAVGGAGRRRPAARPAGRLLRLLGARPRLPAALPRPAAALAHLLLQPPARQLVCRLSGPPLPCISFTGPAAPSSVVPRLSAVLLRCYLLPANGQSSVHLLCCCALPLLPSTR